MVCKLNSGKIWYTYISSPIIYGYFVGTIHENTLFGVCIAVVIDIIQLVLMYDNIGWTIMCVTLGTLLGFLKRSSYPKLAMHIAVGAEILLLFIGAVAYVTAKTVTKMATVSGFPYGMFISSAVCIVYGLLAYAILTATARDEQERMNRATVIYSATFSCVFTHMISIFAGFIILGAQSAKLVHRGDCRATILDILYIAVVSACLVIVDIVGNRWLYMKV